VTLDLGCQTLVEDGMQVLFLNFPTPKNHSYQLDEFHNSWDVQAQFHQVFPEAINCRHCGGCNQACPKGIEIERGVRLAVEGSFKEASKLFLECVMCDLCLTACPEKIAPNHVGLFSRRVTAYFHIRPSNLIYRLEEMRQGKYHVSGEMQEAGGEKHPELLPQGNLSTRGS
jgi:ferredoxin